MALTKATLIDLNSNELILDLDADTSITADTDDTIHFKIAGADELVMTGTALTPAVADGSALGSTSLEWSDIFLADGAVINFGADQDIKITHVADTGLTTNADFTVGDDLFVSGGLIDLKNTGTVSTIKFYCESSNAHAQSVVSAPHSEAASNTLTLPGTGGNARLVSTSSTATLTNKTLTSPVITGTGTIASGAITSSGIIKTDDATEATSTTDGSLQTDGGLSVAKDIVAGDDVKLLSDAAVLNFGADSEIKLTHVADTGLLLTDSGGTPTLQFHDANESISSDAGHLIFTSNGVTFDFPSADGSSGQALVTNGSGVLSFAAAGSNTPSSADGQALGSASLEWSDLFLADAGTIQFGNDQDVTLTHVADTGLLLNTASVIQFRDSAINIGSPADGDLDINADDEIELNSTLIDINGNVEISGTATTTGVHTFTAVPVFPDNTIETADIQADAITGAKIADNAINSEHYTDGSIDAEHLTAGMVLQVVNVELASTTQLTSGGTIGELSTSLRLAITPKNASSTLYFEAFAPFVSPNSINLAYAYFYDVTNSATVNLPSAAGSRIPTTWSKRTTAADVNDMDTLNMTTKVAAASTNARTYTIYHGTEGATHQFLQSSLDSNGSATKIHFRITEVR